MAVKFRSTFSHNDDHQIRAHRAKGSNGSRPVVVSRSNLDDQQLGIRVVQPPQDLGEHEVEINADVDRGTPPSCSGHYQVLRAIRQLADDAVAVADTERSVGSGDAGHCLAELAEGHLAMKRRQRHPLSAGQAGSV